mgnify:CR=1 FL=1
MIRKILTILIAVFSITTISAQKTDLEKEGFKGKIKIVKKVVCDYIDRFGEYEKENCKSYITTFDSDGNGLGIDQNAKHIYKYDPDGNILEEAHYKSTKRIHYIITYKYDSDRNKLEEEKHRSDGSLDYKYTYKYDSDGNRIEQVKYKGDILMPESFISWIFEYYN